MTSGVEHEIRPILTRELDPAIIHSLNSLSPDFTPVQVLDMSRQGLKLRIGRQFLTGSEIQVKLKDLFVLGEIRYCVQVGSETKGL